MRIYRGGNGEKRKITTNINDIIFNKPKEVVNPKVTMKIKDKGNIVIELYPDKAPNTVANFMNLVSSRIL